MTSGLCAARPGRSVVTSLSLTFPCSPRAPRTNGHVSFLPAAFSRTESCFFPPSKSSSPRRGWRSGRACWPRLTRRSSLWGACGGTARRPGTGGRGRPRRVPAGPARPEGSSSPLISTLGGFAELRLLPSCVQRCFRGAVDAAWPDSGVASPAGRAGLGVRPDAAAGMNGAPQGPRGSRCSGRDSAVSGGGGSCRKVAAGRLEPTLSPPPASGRLGPARRLGACFLV